MVVFLTEKYKKSINKYIKKHINKPITHCHNKYRKVRDPNQALHDYDSCTENTQTQTLTDEENTNEKSISHKNGLLSGTKSKVKSETKKVNNLFDKYPTNDITELNYLIYAWAILDCEKSRGPFDEHRQKVKFRVGTQTWITDKKAMATSNNSKTKY